MRGEKSFPGSINRVKSTESGVEILKKRFSKRRLKVLVDDYIGSEGVKSLAGLAVFLGVEKDGLACLGRDDGLSQIVDYARTCIERDVVENGLRGKYNATMATFILKTVFGYTDKPEDAPQEAVKIELSDELRQFAG